MTELKRLSSADAVTFGSFVFASMRKHLSELDSDGPHVAIGAYADRKPAGLIYGEIEDGPNRAGHLRSIFVASPFRNSGVGLELTRALEEAFAEAGCRKIETRYITGKPGPDTLERILSKQGWEEPRTEQLICKTDARMLEWDAYRQCWKEEGYELFSWSELTGEDRQYILETQERDHWVPNDLVPFQYEDNCDRLTSIGIRFRGKPVGWMITHRVAPDTVRYTCSFIHKACQGRFRIGQIYQQAFRRQSEAGIPNAIWIVPCEHEAMFRFTKRRWGGKFADLTESRVRSKELHAQDEAKQKLKGVGTVAGL